jgi:hypothetical protein
MTFTEAPITHELMAGLAEKYASAVLCRQELQTVLRRRLQLVADELAPVLREALRTERDSRDDLAAAVEQAPQLFARPRTRTVAGIQYGWRTGKPQIEVPDEAKTITLIRKLLPEGQQVLLIRTLEHVHKPAVLDLTAADLRRLGIRQSEPEDTIICKPVKDETDRLVAALLADTETPTPTE